MRLMNNSLPVATKSGTALQTKDDTRILGLDMMRAVAIGLVLLSHGRYYLTMIPRSEWHWIDLGFFGVELFFVLSGYLIGGIVFSSLQPGCAFSSVRNFWLRRWFRTLPNYYLALGVSIGSAFLLSGTSAIPHLLRYPVFLQNLAWNKGDFFGVSWSLAVEEWFYLLTPVLLFLLLRLRIAKRTACLLCTLAMILVPTILRVVFFNPSMDWDLDRRSVVIYRLDAIGFGLFGAWCRVFWPAALQYRPLFLFSLGCVLLLGTYHIHLVASLR